MGRCPKQKQGPGEHKLAVSFCVAMRAAEINTLRNL